MSEGGRSGKRRRLHPQNSGLYVLQNIAENLPLVSEDGADEVSITCIEYWNENLYVGTSASEILHLVALPSENEVDPPVFILASRLQPSGYATTIDNKSAGVQQILVLPGPSKACILCNGTVSFYSLPELSPAFPNNKLTGVQWIGGIDENQGRDSQEGPVVMIATAPRIRLVKVGDKLKTVRNNIEYPGCLKSSRRDTIACVADSKGYALIEVEHQQKIPLFPISSSTDNTAVEAPSKSLPGKLDSNHGRSSSLGVFSSTVTGDVSKSNEQSLRPPLNEGRAGSPALSGQNGSRPSSRPRSSTDTKESTLLSQVPSQRLVRLSPHVLTPTTAEFMLTTGTVQAEPGVGMFVNLDGDVVRGTVEFDRYPEAVITHDFSSQASEDAGLEEDQVIIALLDKSTSIRQLRGLEIQSISNTGGSKVIPKAWVPLPGEISNSSVYGLHHCLSPHQHVFAEVADLLRASRLKVRQQSDVEPDARSQAAIQHLEQETALFENQADQPNGPTPEYEQRRNEEEYIFVKRLGHFHTRAVVWLGTELYQILPNPLLLQMEHAILQTNVVVDDTYSFVNLDVSKTISFLGSIRDREPKDETEFLSINYVRQKASLMLFLHLLSKLRIDTNLDAACRLTESALHESGLDPRVPLSLLPPLSRNVLQGPNGIWIHQGIIDCVDGFRPNMTSFETGSIELWMMMRHYLNTWQEKRGYGSITDEKYVFDSVDASLLHILLYLDQVLTRGSGVQTSTRVKLHNVVDHWKGDLNHAIALLEHYQRFFVLSRLYASKKQSKDVLFTWKRICEGENDADKDLSTETVYQQMRRYLTVIRDTALVQEYGLWLAKRNSDLAVQFFSDDNSRVKFNPAEVVAMLKDHAPGAVQQYLEHLVFGKHLDQYADDLIGYYLDSVLNVLETSESARQSLSDSYSTYRALTSPKPTYLNFIMQNTPEEPWWQSRLRLLQLLGSGGFANAGTTGKDLNYSIELVLERLKPFSTYLVSESIILDARQGRHKEALQLLTRGLGDYDTAVRYCYFGGPAPSSSTIDASLLPSREHQQELFAHLFQEFLVIEDVEDRLERTSHLLGTFATWFDPLQILQSIPDEWSVGMLSEFLLRSFRAATSERNQAMIIKALSATQNLQKQAEFIEICEKIGSTLQAEDLVVESDITIS